LFLSDIFDKVKDLRKDHFMVNSGKVILEDSIKLSESILWKMQNEAYQQFGPEAWSSKGVPFYLTSTPYTVRQYALQVLAYFRDCISLNSPTPIDFSEPVYIFDLGAGTGRFGYLFLKMLNAMLEGLSFKKIKIRYVMTDIVDSNIKFCQTHPYLKQYIECGVLDFAHFHHRDRQITLIYSGDELTSEKVKNPIILVANYFFDTIPQDLFQTQKGTLNEGRITLSVIKGDLPKGKSPLDPTLIGKLQTQFDYYPLDFKDNYYANHPELNAILEEYKVAFPDSTFLFPVGAFECIDYFSSLSKNRILLLAADQGVVSESQIKSWGEPKIAIHGSFSLAVDYSSLAAYFRNKNGVSLLTSFPDKQFVVMSGILGGSMKNFPESVLMFRQTFDSFEPVDYWKLINLSDEGWKNPSLEYILLLIKLGNWDPINFYFYFSQIQKGILQASLEVKEEIAMLVDRVWEYTYPINGSEGLFVMNLGVLCYQLEKYKKAIYFFEQSLAFTGPQKQTFVNLSLCHMSLKNLEKAQEYSLKASQTK
jgi:tetratricopeptide (TPR) repeat protein